MPTITPAMKIYMAKLLLYGSISQNKRGIIRVSCYQNGDYIGKIH